MRYLLVVLSYLLLPLMVIAMLWRGFKTRAYWKRLAERFGLYKFPALKESIWIHAVSVGEVQAAVPLVKRLQHRYPNENIVVTTQTPTGSERVQKIFGESVVHTYVPYDAPYIVRRFIKQMQPRLAIIMETEIWPILYAQCAKSSIPIIMASARISPRSINSYQRFKYLFEPTLNQVHLIAAQTSRDAERFLSLGAAAKRVRVIGNLKFDFMFVPSNLQERGQDYYQKYFTGRPVWIAASTHDSEENTVLEVHKKLLALFPNLVLILAPRHPERSSQVLSLIMQKDLIVCRRSTSETPTEKTQVFLLDTLGELPMFYAASQVAFVGGSLVPIGGHNLLEPAALSIPILVGPHTFNAPEISEMLEEVGALEGVRTQGDFQTSITSLLKDPALAKSAGSAGREVVAENFGALDKLLAEIELILTL